MSPVISVENLSENIFLNGAILGMSRAQISKDFDRIVVFAEAEKILDTHVKHYSRGMQPGLTATTERL